MQWMLDMKIALAWQMREVMLQRRPRVRNRNKRKGGRELCKKRKVSEPDDVRIGRDLARASKRSWKFALDDSQNVGDAGSSGMVCAECCCFFYHFEA